MKRYFNSYPPRLLESISRTATAGDASVQETRQYQARASVRPPDADGRRNPSLLFSAAGSTRRAYSQQQRSSTTFQEVEWASSGLTARLPALTGRGSTP
jgi:hypothetical protein